MCHGEPGIGKTRLAEELVARARTKDVSTVWGRAVETDGAPPYWPWRQVIRATAGVVDIVALADECGLTDDLGGLAPDVFLSGHRAVDAGSPEDRFRQFDAVGRLLRQVALRRPLVIVLDDIHWADQASLLLLQHVTRMLTDEKFLFVVNYRDTERKYSSIAVDLMREPVSREVHLLGLPARAVATQLASVIGHEVNDAEVEQVCELTGGNPFFVGEVARGLAAPRGAVSRSMVTSNLRDAIGARLDRMSLGCMRLVQAASIMGREFGVEFLSAMVGEPVLRCLDFLDEAVGAGLVEVGPTPGKHQFVHALVRDAIEDGLSSAQRVRLHRNAAEAIETTYGGQIEGHLFDLAQHWAVAAVEGDAATAAGWIQRAAEEAMRRLAFEDAARLFRQALDVGGGELSDTDRCRLLLAVGAALHASADVVGRLDACLQAAAVARRIGRVDLLAEAPLILEGVFGYPDSDVAAKRLCEEAMTALDPKPSPLRARVTARFAEACMYLCDFENAAPASENALRLAHECGDRGALIAALHARRLVCEGPDGVTERERLSDWMLALGREDRNPSVELWARLWRVDTCFERGDLYGVARELEALALPAQDVGGPWARWQLLRGQAVLAQARARFGDARRLAAEAFSVIAPTGHPIAALPRAALLQTVGHHIGQDQESLAANGLAQTPVDPVDFTRQRTLMMVLGPAHLLAEAGRLAEAASLYRSLGPAAGWRPDPHATLAAYAFGIGVAIAVEATDEVAVLRHQLAPYRGLHVASGAGAVAYLGPVELWLGVAARYVGLLDEAVFDLEQAVRCCAINGAAGFRAEAQYELAVALARRSAGEDLARARSLVADAARQATDLGMVPIASRSGELIEQLDADEPPAPLTRREREVAELVTKGLTSREIAERLYLSERTVQNHVQHILTKLGLSNRSQIAVWITVQK
jgi:DNA-binding CsgD family transcriptional regulator